MNSTDTQQSLKQRLLLAISAGALLAGPGCGGNTSSEPNESQQRGSRDTSSTEGSGATTEGTGGTDAGPTVTTASHGGPSSGGASAAVTSSESAGGTSSGGTASGGPSSGGATVAGGFSVSTSGGGSSSGGAIGFDTSGGGASNGGATFSSTTTDGVSASTTRGDLACSSPEFLHDFCLTTEAMENQARYGFGQIPMDPPRSDEEVAAGYDANGCMRQDWVATGCCNSGLEPGTRAGNECCYIACDDGCCGRPLVLGGVAITAPAVSRGDWVTLSLDSLGGAHETVAAAALAESWQTAALAEHASVASFARFALQLLALGAPHELVRDAQLAALDEIDHARRCFDIASRLSGRLIGPGRLSEAAANVETDLAEVVVATIHEGCVGETLAAALASEQARVAEVPEVRDTLLKIAADEARHAELAWRFVAWALQRSDPRVRRLADAAFREALARSQRPFEEPKGGIDRAALHAWGQLSLEESAALTRQTLGSVVGPAARQLLASVAPGRPESAAARSFPA